MSKKIEILLGPKQNYILNPLSSSFQTSLLSFATMSPINMLFFENMAVCYSASHIKQMIEGTENAEVSAIYIKYNISKRLQEEDPVSWYITATQNVWVEIKNWCDTEVAYSTIQGLRNGEASINFSLCEYFEALEFPMEEFDTAFCDEEIRYDDDDEDVDMDITERDDNLNTIIEEEEDDDNSTIATDFSDDLNEIDSVGFYSFAEDRAPWAPMKTGHRSPINTFDMAEIARNLESIMSDEDDDNACYSGVTNNRREEGDRKRMKLDFGYKAIA